MLHNFRKKLHDSHIRLKTKHEKQFCNFCGDNINLHFQQYRETGNRGERCKPKQHSLQCEGKDQGYNCNRKLAIDRLKFFKSFFIFILYTFPWSILPSGN
jgi:hypothetical protein